MIKAITHWDSLLLGHPFVVETDHKNLCFLYKSDNPKVVPLGYTQFLFPLPAQSMRCK